MKDKTGDTFKIYVEQLRDGRERQIQETLTPDFLEVNEKDLAFKKDVQIEGKAYLAEHELVIHWNIQTEALVACSICNEKVPVEIRIENRYYSKPLSEIKSGIFNFKDLLRETILIEVPSFVEHNEGNCPKRQEFSKYLRTTSPEISDEEEGYQPFVDLDWK
jgi:uncharacterized metal-binding protein YceD (DUF177 family)